MKVSIVQLLRTMNEMTLFDLMTGRSKVPTTEEECHENEEKQTVEVVDGAHKKFRGKISKSMFYE